MHREKLKRNALVVLLILVPVVLLIPLRHRAQRNQQRRKNNALISFVQQGNFKSVQALITQGADVNISAANDRSTPLHKVSGTCASNSVETTRVLLRNGAKINSRDINGTTALMNASGRGCVDIVALLLSNGADVANKDIHGDTALCWALSGAESEYQDKRTQLKIGKMLKQAGAKQ